MQGRLLFRKGNPMRPAKNRFPGWILVGALALSAPLLAVPPAPLSDSGLLGSAQDPRGNFIDGVEIVLVAGRAAVAPVAVVTSGLDGRFRVPSLAHGVYRVAAIKRGYSTFIGTVDTHASRWLDVVLHPAEAVDGSMAESEAWPLRLGRRPVFREVERREIVEAPISGGQGSGSFLPDAMSLEVDQSLAFASTSGGGRDDLPTLSGTETRLRLASALGPGGNVEVRGSRSRLGPPGNGQAPPGASSRSADQFDFVVGYDTGDDSRVQVEGFYDHRDLVWRGTAEGAESRELQSIWGSDVAWINPLENGDELKLSLNYRDNRFDTPHDLATSREIAPSQSRSLHRAATVGVDYRRKTQNHEWSIGFSARGYDNPAGYFDNLIDPALVATGERAGSYALALDTQDRWDIAGPLVLTYGLGYRHTESASRIGLLAPRFGGRLEWEPVKVGLTLAYHAVTESQAAPGGVQLFEPEHSIGYDIDAEIALGAKARLEISIEYAPVQMELSSSEDGAIRELADSYVSDGNVDVQSERVAWVHESDRSLTFLELQRGEAHGLLASYAPTRLYVRQLAFRELVFNRMRLGVRANRSGTLVHLDYDRVSERTAGPAGALGEQSDQQALRFALMQDLVILREMGSWRLLVGLGYHTFESDSSLETIGSDLVALRDGASGEVSAGLSVAF